MKTVEHAAALAARDAELAAAVEDTKVHAAAAAVAEEKLVAERQAARAALEAQRAKLVAAEAAVVAAAANERSLAKQQSRTEEVLHPEPGHPNPKP